MDYYIISSFVLGKNSSYIKKVLVSSFSLLKVCRFFLKKILLSREKINHKKILTQVQRAKFSLNRFTLVLHINNPSLVTSTPRPFSILPLFFPSQRSLFADSINQVENEI